MNPILSKWNEDTPESAMDAMIACCGARRWAAAMVAARPVADEETLHAISDRNWDAMREEDWREAFAAHPRIGERKTAQAPARAADWSRDEQSGTAMARQSVLAQLAEGNLQYEDKFGFTFIVCATGRTADDMLAILERRLAGDLETELREAAEQQRQIMHIRLRKWLAP